MGKQMQKLHEELAERVVEAEVGAGMVSVRANGRGELISVTIDPELMKPEEKDTLQELVLSAVNEVGRKARELAKSEMAKLTGGIDVAGILGIS